MEQYSSQEYGRKAETGYEFLAKTYGWMFIALLVSAVFAFAGATNPVVFSLVWGTKYGMTALVVLELALVILLTATIRKLSYALAITCFIVYAAINGLTLSSIFLIFQVSSIALAFISTAIMFGIMSFYGATTKKNLATAGHYLMMALLGVVVVSLVNFVITLITKKNLAILDWFISLASVIIFTGLTAYDAQKIAMIGSHNDGSEAYKKIAIYGALQLYLDFINIFLSLLKLFGKKR